MVKCVIKVGAERIEDWLEYEDVRKGWNDYFQMARKGLHVAFWYGVQLLSIANSSNGRMCWIVKDKADIINDDRIYTEKEIRRNRVIEKVFNKKVWECSEKVIKWANQ